MSKYHYSKKSPDYSSRLLLYSKVGSVAVMTIGDIALSIASVAIAWAETDIVILIASKQTNNCFIFFKKHPSVQFVKEFIQLR